MDFLKKIFIFLFSVGFFVCFSGLAFAGFGISPPSVLNKNLLPGSSYEQIIYIVRSEPVESLKAEVKIDAGEATSWITIENGNTFEVPKGIQQFPMKVRVNVPKDAKLGEYKGTIELLTSSNSSTKQSAPVKVNLGAEIGVDLEVTNSELVDYNIQGLNIKDVPSGLPAVLTIKIQNRGNGPAGPTKVKVIFYDIYHSAKLWEGQKDISEKVDSFSLQDINVELSNNGLELGQYWADVEIFDGEKTIEKTKFVFNVVESSSVLKNGKFAFDFFNKKYLIIAGFILIALILLLIVWIIIKKIRNRHKIKINNAE